MKFWEGKNVLITGHMGFKGSWLKTWLEKLGAKVKGMDIKESQHACNVVRPFEFSLDEKADVVFHLAAQAIVKTGYDNPKLTYETNVMGTLNVLEACRLAGVPSTVVVTSDKVYHPKDSPCIETDKIGGSCPYSSSKSVVTNIVSAYNVCYHIPVAEARAGNVIGGGDFGAYRLIPDIIRAVESNKPIIIRNKDAIRPYQHVLDCLSGYLLLAEKLYKDRSYSGAWNIGPVINYNTTVSSLVSYMTTQFKLDVIYEKADFKETQILKLDSTKAVEKLGFKPKWDIEKSLKKTVEWYKAYLDKKDMTKFTLKQIKEWEND